MPLTIIIVLPQWLKIQADNGYQYFTLTQSDLSEEWRYISGIVSYK
jgi:hypothetical protein